MFFDVHVQHSLDVLLYLLEMSTNACQMQWGLLFIISLINSCINLQENLKEDYYNCTVGCSMGTDIFNAHEMIPLATTNMASFMTTTTITRLLWTIVWKGLVFYMYLHNLHNNIINSNIHLYINYAEKFCSYVPYKITKLSQPYGKVARW